jgi:hypothetical protein
MTNPKMSDIPERISQRGDCSTISWNSSLLSSISFVVFSIAKYFVTTGMRNEKKVKSKKR